MTKYTEEVDLIKSVLGHIKNVVYKGTFKWKDGNTLIFTSKTKIEEGKIVFKDKDITITGKKIDDLFKNYKAIYKNAEKNKVKPSDITGTALSKLLSSTSKFGGLEMNPTVVKQLNAEFKKFGIKDIVMEGNKTQNNTLSTNLTLFISTNPDGCGTSMSSGWVGRLRTFLFDEFEHNNKNKDEINIREINKFKPLEGEKPILMTYKGTTLGYYFPERNLIHLLFNPFILNTQSVFAETYSRNWDYIFAMFSEAKVKKNDISKIQEKLFISEFMKNSRNRLENVKNSQASTKRDIVSYENKIMGKIEEYSTLCSEEDFLQQLIDNKGKGLFEEIDKVKKLPFVVKLDIESSEINVKFRETFMPIPDMIRHDSGKSFGKRYIWIGGIGFKISAGNFSVYGDVDVHNSHCHPHSSGFPQGGPCFGSGDGRNKIYELLAANKFVELTKMLWFWVKTYKNSGAYVKVWDAYDSILKQGYPVLDDKGKRIEINDPDRIKSGEQRKLEKSSSYEDNIKKFSKTEMEV